VVAKAEDAAELQNVQDLSEITLDALLDPGAKHPEDKQARLISINAAKKKRFKLIALVGLAILAYFTVDIGYDLYKDKKKREDLAATARAAAEAAKNALPRAAEPPAFAPVTLPLPSSQFPTATLTLVRCVNQVNELAARVGGWNLAATRCDGNTVSATYNRSENGRPVNVLHELLPGAVTNDAGTIATITYGLPAAQVRSGETLLETVEAREAFVGFFQQLHESVTLTAKPLTPGIFNSLAAVPAEKLNKEAVTIQPFAAYSFTASTARIPTRLTPAFQLPGVVIRDITTTFARDANNRFTKTYTINGDLYAL
jgi:hypothetical protein